MNRYISDTHFFHENANRFDKSPFANEELRRETMILNWNNYTNDDDDVYILGDMFWRGHEAEAIAIMKRLKGRKHLILGNHDRVQGKIRFEFADVQERANITDNGRHVVLSHFPEMFYNRQHYGAIMLYGHVHNTIEQDFLVKWQEELRNAGIPCNVINVGCMQPYMNYTPRTLDEILAAYPFFPPQNRK